MMRRLRSLAIAAILAGVPAVLRAQMQTGENMTRYKETLGLKERADYAVILTETNAPACIFIPGETPRLGFRLTNRTAAAIRTEGRIDRIRWGTKGVPGDIWVPECVAFETLDPVPLRADIPAGGWQDVTMEIPIPEVKGGYAFVVDLGPSGRALLATVVRTFAPVSERIQYPRQSLDYHPRSGSAFLERLGIQAVRIGAEFRDSADVERLAEEFADLHEHKVTAVVEFGASGDQPLGRPRPHLDDRDTLLDTKSDMAWLPEQDDLFEEFVYNLACRYGWPKGPVTGFMLWNEPWEGISISGWGADMIRYRDMYRRIGRATERARKDAGVDILIGGCDSSSNTWDKLFPDGSDEFVPYFDFCSIHYQGLDAPVLYKEWLNRTYHKGRVLIWDTESWVANTDDRIAGVVATNRASGYDRALGVFIGNVLTTSNHGERAYADLAREDGKTERVMLPMQAFPPAASIGAVQHFLGEREFGEILFKNGLPWVYRFDGLKGNADDGTIVVIGDIGSLFDPDTPLFRTVDVTNAALEFGSEGGLFRLYDFYGNPVPDTGGTIRIPLDDRGFFLRADPTRAGSFAALEQAVRAARIEGIEPLEMVAKDFLDLPNRGTTLRLRVTNVLNRRIGGELRATVAGLSVDTRPRLTFAPHETKDLEVPVRGPASPGNTYATSLRFDAGADGVATHEEDLRVNRIAKRTIAVDGKLDDWEGTLPQPVVGTGSETRTLTEAAWLPFEAFKAGTSGGLATGYLAYDDRFFYFAAKVADDTPDPGTLRFETRNDDEFFYPEVAYVEGEARGSASDFCVRWTGTLVPPASGEYTFATFTDDGVRLHVGEQAVIDNWTDHGGAWDRETVRLEAGKPVAIRLEYYQGGGDASCRFFWKAPEAGAEEAVPTVVLYPDAAAAAGGKPGTGLKAEYFRGRDFNRLVLTRTDPVVDFKAFPGDPSAEDFAAPKTTRTALRWPEGVRRYSYRKNPVLPSGNAPDFDNIQIAFNAIPAGEDDCITHLPGRMPGFVAYQCTDYEYALNTVAPDYGGGTEIWRLKVPGMPRKHFYPRQPKHPLEGPVANAALATVHTGTTRITEAAIPWTEIPHVKALLDAGKTVRFTFRVNNNTGGPTMELAKGRSVSKRNYMAFHVDWKEHWANEIEFAFEK